MKKLYVLMMYVSATLLYITAFVVLIDAVWQGLKSIDDQAPWKLLFWSLAAILAATWVTGIAESIGSETDDALVSPKRLDDD